MKKLICLLLALVCVLSLAACGKGGGLAGSGDKQNSGTTADGKVLLTIGLPVNAHVLDYKNNALTKYLENELNYELEFIPYSGGSEIGTQIATAITAGEALPDIIWGVALGEQAISRYGKDDYFQDLSKYFADREGASKVYWERVEANYSDYEIDNIKRKMVDADTGEIYYIPSMETSLVDIMDYQVWINTVWLDNLGLKMPTTTQEFYDTLVAFKTKDPNKNGKADEIPLYGSEAGGLGADVVNFVINMFLYFDDRKNFAVGEDGKLYAPFTTEEYRKALQFANKLYAEKLMPDAVFTTSSGDLQKVTTPASGEALVGIFCGHLTLHAMKNNDLLKQYQPMPYLKGQSVVFNDNTYSRNVFITSSCANPDAAFKLIMKMFEEESSWRIRYGEYKVNWDYAPEGSISELGLPAKMKIIDDPFSQQNTCLWSSVAGTLNVYAECEAAIMAEESSDWMKLRNKMAAQSRKNGDAAAEANNPDKLCPTLVYTEEELELTERERTAVADHYKKSRTDFIKNKLDPYGADWDTYVKQVQEYGLEAWLAVAQNAYERDPQI